MKSSLAIAFSSSALLIDHSTALVNIPPTKPVSRNHQIRRYNVNIGAGPTSHLSDDGETTQKWATHALLFSSWTDGVASNSDAQSFLKYSLLRKMLRDKIHRHEDEVKSSVEFSPCNGPDVNALNNLELVDKLIDRGQKIFGDDDVNLDGDTLNTWSNEVQDYLISESIHDSLDLRFLYIPTAMYALNPQSTNTPGKQRQRARADGKKRRDQVVNVLNELLDINRESRPNVCAITLDLDDGSLKQPTGFLDQDSVPLDAKLALSTWNPHLIYVEGGNTFWLQHCIEKGNYSQLIKDACTGPKGAVYCGKSAGAIVAGRSIETATWKGWDDPSVVPGKESYDQWIGCRGFEFAGDRSFFPHYSIDWEDIVREKTADGPMSDSTTVLHEDDVCIVVSERNKSFMLDGKSRLNLVK